MQPFPVPPPAEQEPSLQHEKCLKAQKQRLGLKPAPGTCSTLGPGGCVGQCPSCPPQGEQRGEDPGNLWGTSPKLGVPLRCPQCSPICGQSGLITAQPRHMGANGIRGKNQPLPVNRITGCSAQPRRSCHWGALGSGAPWDRGSWWGQPRPAISPFYGGLGAATGVYWCGRAACQHSTGIYWEALPGSDGRSVPCPRLRVCPPAVALTGDTAPPSAAGPQLGAGRHRDPPAAAGGIKASIHGRA